MADFNRPLNGRETRRKSPGTGKWDTPDKTWSALFDAFVNGNAPLTDVAKKFGVIYSAAYKRANGGQGYMLHPERPGTPGPDGDGRDWWRQRQDRTDRTKLAHAGVLDDEQPTTKSLEGDRRPVTSGRDSLKYAIAQRKCYFNEEDLADRTWLSSELDKSKRELETALVAAREHCRKFLDGNDSSFEFLKSCQKLFGRVSDATRDAVMFERFLAESVASPEGTATAPRAANVIELFPRRRV